VNIAVGLAAIALMIVAAVWTLAAPTLAPTPVPATKTPGPTPSAKHRALNYAAAAWGGKPAFSADGRLLAALAGLPKSNGKIILWGYVVRLFNRNTSEP
jgi:hypothetical protein